VSVRLYPMTQAAAVLEQLVGVPAATMARLAHTRAALPNYELEPMVRADPDLRALDNLCELGWGRANAVVCPSAIGQTTDPVQIAEILAAHGVDLAQRGVEAAELAGLYWG
jgi:hypothetical protein